MLEKFRHLFPVSESQWLDYSSCFKRLAVPARTCLLKEGEVSKKFYVIEKGCIRVWFNNNGKDITTQFFFENNTVASIESFKKNIPSPVCIETIEPVVVWWIHKKDWDRILEEIKSIPALRDKFIDAIFERTFNYVHHFISVIRDTPLQRYLHLVKEHPAIIQRVPQHYIASYLGISPVHLSRIKNQLTKGRI